MPTAFDFCDFVHLTDVAQARDRFLPVLEADWASLLVGASLPAPLGEACDYAMAAGGKRIRPLLALAAFLACQGDSAQWPMLRRAALAVEILHGYSLVHDDLPCMDDDDLRRGRPTCHIVYGQSVALLAGDGLQSLAFEALATPAFGAPDDKIASALLAVFAPRARRMVAGQTLDTLGEKKTLNAEQLQRVHRDKTGALIEAAMLMGAVCAKASPKKQAHVLQAAQNLGLAFQVQDDVLDSVGDARALGKPTGSDDRRQKSTYARLLGANEASRYADTLFAAAQSTAQRLDRSALLQNLIAWIARRDR